MLVTLAALVSGFSTLMNTDCSCYEKTAADYEWPYYSIKCSYDTPGCYMPSKDRAAECNTLVKPCPGIAPDKCKCPVVYAEGGFYHPAYTYQKDGCYERVGDYPFDMPNYLGGSCK